MSRLISDAMVMDGVSPRAAAARMNTAVRPASKGGRKKE